MFSPLCHTGSSESFCLLHVISGTRDFITSIQATLLRLVSLIVSDLLSGKTFYHSNSFLGAGARCLQTARQGFALYCHHTTLPLQLPMAWDHSCLGCIQLGQHIFLGSRTWTSLIHKETEAGALTSLCPLRKKHSPSLLPSPGRQAAGHHASKHAKGETKIKQWLRE